MDPEDPELNSTWYYYWVQYYRIPFSNYYVLQYFTAVVQYESVFVLQYKYCSTMYWDLLAKAITSPSTTYNVIVL